MASWTDIADTLRPEPADQEAASRVLDEFGKGSPISRTQSSLLRLSDAAIASFYAALEAGHSPRRACKTEPDSSWMIRSDFCFLNVRACARDGRAGTFLQASKILPAIAADAIHLAPFHPVHFELLYASESQSMIDPSLVDPALASAGIGPEDQVRAFTLACRLLGKAPGFDLQPYATQFGRVVMERPELFRWLHLDDERVGLLCADPDAPYVREERMESAMVVKDLVTSIKEDYGVLSLKRAEGDSEEISSTKDKAYFASIQQCIDRGLWPVLMNPRTGVGLPAFLRFDHAGNFPTFAYRDQNGADASAEASGVVTPYAFYDDLPDSLSTGSGSAAERVPRRNDEAIRYYARVFERWRDDFGFDFVRYDSVDHILDTCADELGCVPLSDRPTPEVLREAIETSRDSAPGAGALAEGSAAEIGEYSALGFDLVMGSDMLRRVDAPLIHESFALYDRLSASAAERNSRPVSVCFAVDAHDTGDHRRWGTSLAKLMGRDRMRLRHGTARFLSVGPVRRPMYETMGFQDMSTGLYEADISVRGLDWADDEAFAAGYASTETLYRSFRPFMDAARITDRHLEANHAWWIIRGKSPQRALVVACSLETGEGLPPGKIVIPLDHKLGDLEGKAYRLPDPHGVPATAEGSLVLDLGYLDMIVVDLASAFY